MLANDSMWQTSVLIPKGTIRYFRGIGLVKLFWKDVTILLNCRLATAINFHYVLHGFWAGRRTGTAAPLTDVDRSEERRVR